MDEKRSWKDNFKHLVLTGETYANEQRKAERKHNLDTGDIAFKFLLAFFFLAFWVFAIWKQFA